jgi:hypothetical protein
LLQLTTVVQDKARESTLLDRREEEEQQKGKNVAFTPVQQRPSRQVAICFAGLSRGIETNLGNLIQRLIVPLDADVFVMGPDAENFGGAPASLLNDRLIQFETIPDPSTEDLLKIIPDPSFAKVYQSWEGLCFQASEISDHFTALLYDQSMCLRAIDAHEKSRDARYNRIVFSRTDFHWLGTHPSLTLLPENIPVWTFGIFHYTGYNDRHAVLTRSAADVYLSRWESLLDGSAMSYSADFADYAKKS